MIGQLYDLTGKGVHIAGHRGLIGFLWESEMIETKFIDVVRRDDIGICKAHYEL